MADNALYKSNPRLNFCKLSMSESDTDLLNSTVNQRGNPSQFIPHNQAESNSDVSTSGFIDETPYRGPGTRLQKQWEGIEARIANIIAHFHNLRLEIGDWENVIKTHNVSPTIFPLSFPNLRFIG